MPRIPLACLLIFAFAATSPANTITFVTPAGSTQGGKPVSAEADFTTTTNQVTVNLKNLLTASQMMDIGQALSDLIFTISGTFAGTVDNTDRTYTGLLINVGSNGAVSPGTGSFNGWDFSNLGTTFTLEDLGSAAGPAQTILGGAGAPNYPNANASIAGNGPHNPFLQGNAMFTLTITGVTSATNITAATFSFGTTVGNTVPGVPVPEPTALVSLGTGLLLLGVFAGMRKREPRASSMQR